MTTLKKKRRNEMKTRAKNLLRFGFYSAGAAVILTQSCFAYIDPATTSLIIQIIAGVVIACGTAVGIFWSRIKRKFKKKTDEEPEAAANIKQEGDSDEKVVITADELLAEDEDASEK